MNKLTSSHDFVNTVVNIILAKCSCLVLFLSDCNPFAHLGHNIKVIVRFAHDSLATLKVS